MATMPYLHFQGQCAEALGFYAKALGGSDLRMMRYADSPDAPAAWKGSERIIHGQVTLGDGTLMASDFPPGQEGQPQQAVSIMQSAPDSATAAKWFHALANGGTVIQDFGPTFFSSGFGMLKDRFGTHWIIAAGPAG